MLTANPENPRHFAEITASYIDSIEKDLYNTEKIC